MIMVGDMQTGQLISFISYVTQILMSLMMISMAFYYACKLKKAESGDRIVEIIDEKLILLTKRLMIKFC